MNKNSPLVTCRIIWAAFLVSSVTYVSILNMRPAPIEPNDLLLKPLALVAFVGFVMSFILPSILLKTAAKNLAKPVTVDEAMKAFTQPFIVRMAFAEMPAVVGFLVGMQMGVNVYYPFWGMSLIALLAAFPSEDAIMRRFTKS